MTATSEYMETSAVYRQQWMGFEAAPTTATAQFQFPFVDHNMSAGAWAMMDEVGPVQLYQFGGAYSYKIRTGRFGQLSVGLSAAVNQWQFNSGNAITVDDDDPVLSGQRNTSLQPDFGVGFLYTSDVGMYELRTNGFFIGVGAQQLLQFDEEPSANAAAVAGLSQRVHANAIIGARFVNRFTFVEPSLWVDYTHEGLLFARANVLYEMEDTFWAGGAIASDYSISLQGGLILADGFLGGGDLRLGGMGTYNIGSLGAYQGAGFEVVVAYRYWR